MIRAKTVNDRYEEFDPYQGPEKRCGGFLRFDNLNVTVCAAIKMILPIAKKRVPKEYHNRIAIGFAEPKVFFACYGEGGFVSWRMVPVGKEMPKRVMILNPTF